MFAFLATKTGREAQPTTIGALVCMTTLGLAAWQTGEGLRITTIVQGGYRDIMGTFFFGCGFIFSQHKETTCHSILPFLRCHWLLMSP